MKLFTCNEFQGHYPVGSAAVIIAENKAQAVELLKQELVAYGLAQEITEDMLVQVTQTSAKAVILCDGNY